MKKHLLISLAGILMHFTAAAQQNQAQVTAQNPTQANPGQGSLPPGLEKLTSSLDNWVETLPQEKVYLHTDKPYYATGDTIWFKAYVVVGSRHQLSALSGALYVELIDETGSVSQERRLPLVAGTAKGNFALSSGVKEGNYRLRAYTQWMRNAGPDYFYDITFPVGNVVSQSMAGAISYEYQEEKGKKILMATMHLQDARSGTPLSNSKVEYEFRKGMEDYIDRGETDAAGNLRFPVPEDFRSNSYLFASIENAEGELVTKTFPINAGAGTDVQFFPEGGELISGLPSRVAFKAAGPGGRGVPVNGFVVDAQNDTLAELESRHAGMGFFTITPEAGQQYRALVNFPDGSRKELPLPQPQESGYVIWAYPYLNSDTLLLRIMAGESSYGNVNLLIHASGEVLDAASVNINRPLSSLRIPCSHYPSGIASITLFDEQNRPLCERVVFIRRADTLHLALSAGGAKHATREHVQVALRASDKDGNATSGSFSAAVINESKVPPGGIPEHTIFSQLLLRSDIRGYIEDPAYYFKDNSRETAEQLDLLMMTQGYRRFTWTELLEEPLPEPEYQPETLLTPVSGKLLTLGGKPVAGGTVTLFSLSGIMRDTTTNARGEFSFGNILLGKDVSFSVQGRNARGGKKVEVVMDPVAGREPVSPNPNPGDLRGQIGADIETYLANSLAQLKDLENHGMTERVNMLQGVTVTARNNNAEGGTFAIPEGHADQTLRLEQPELCGNLLLCLRGKLHGVIFKSTGMTMAPYSRGNRMAVFLNGRMITDELELADIFENNGVDPADVVRVEVVRSNVALLAIFQQANTVGDTGGALLITTRSGGTRPAPYTPEMAHYAPRGFDVAREFYSPRYDTPRRSLLTDFRTTIHWAPGLVTGTDGKAAFDFFNADQPGTYRIVVEGINGAGQLGRAVLRYQVE